MCALISEALKDLICDASQNWCATPCIGLGIGSCALDTEGGKISPFQIIINVEWNV